MDFTPHRIAAAIVLSAFAGCSQPHSDVVATNTEDTGDWAIVAARDGDALNARLCVADPARADLVIDRVLQQLYSRGYRTIALDVYKPGGSIKRLVWMSGTRQVEPLAAAAPSGFCGTT